jgi:cyclohexanecarboxylate-CoA ligase
VDLDESWWSSWLGSVPVGERTVSVPENLVTSPDQAHRYRRAGLWTSDTLAARVFEHCRHRPQAVAVVDSAGRRTYERLGRDCVAVASMIQAHGVEAGDVVSIQLPNRYETVVAAVAAQAIGAIINPLLPNYRAFELAHVFRTARPRMIFTPAVYRGWDYRPMVDELRSETGVSPVHVVVDETERGGDAHLQEVLTGSPVANRLQVVEAASDVSEIIFTSGTESTPKAVMHTEETVNFAVRTAFADLQVPDSAVVWMPSPVGHSTGFNYGLRAALYHGRTLVLQDLWDPSEAVEAIERDRCTYTLAATTFLDDLIRECERTGSRLPSLTHFGCGGAPVPASLVELAARQGVQVLRLYGSTEVLCATWNRPGSPPDKKSHTDGPALSHSELEIRDDSGQIVPGPGEGELYIRGPNTSVGFYQDPERTAATYQGGWVRSGDLVSLDTDQYLTVVGRKKEILIRGGINIAPREIEDLIAAFPEVRQAAVIGVPDDRLGERGCACVVLEEGTNLDLDTMTSRLRARGLATYKLPERIEIVDRLPSTASGKVQKHELLKRILGGAP